MKGKRIKTIQQLAKAAQERKSVVGWLGKYGVNPDGSVYPKAKPASFVIQMSAFWVLDCLETGLYIYHPERKKKYPAVRNPEGIDFELFPIPNGYTVASEIPYTVPGDWMLKVGSVGWREIRTGLIKTRRDNWTYLRPLRRGEKGVRV